MKRNPTFLDRTNLQQEWLLDGNGNSSNGGIDLTATNVTWVTSSVGYTSEVAELNNTNAYLSNGTAQTIGIGNSWSIVAWINGDTLSSTDDAILSLENPGVTANDALFFRMRNNKVYLHMYSSTGSVIKLYIGQTSVSTNEWNQIIATWDGTNLKFFINTVEDTYTKTTDNSGTMGTQTRKVQVGASNGVNLFDGNIGLVRIYSSVLTEDEMSDLYLEGLRRLGATNQLFNNTDFSKYSLPNLRDGLVLDISRAAVAGTYHDQSGSGNNGTNNGVVDSALGLNNIMTFDGVNDYIDTGINNLSTANGISIYGRINQSVSGFGRIFDGFNSAGNNWVRISADGASGEIDFQIRNNANTNYKVNQSISADYANKWCFFALTWDGTTSTDAVKIQINTKIYSFTSSEVGGTQGGTSSTHKIGCQGNTSSPFFNGQMSNIKVKQQGMNPNELQQLYYSNFITD